MKALIGVVVGALVVILVIIGFANRDENDLWDGDKGLLFIGITDDTANITAVNDIALSIKKIELQDSSGAWITASSNSKTYPLLTLKKQNKVELHDKEQLPVGSYTSVRVTIGDVDVQTRFNGTVEALVPSKEYIFNTTVEIGASTTIATVLTLDFIADQSLHIAGDKQTYIFAPVVKTESTSNAHVTHNDDDSLIITGGTVVAAVDYGTDLDGTVRPNFILKTDKSLKVEHATSGIRYILGGKTYTNQQPQVSTTSNTSNHNSLKASTTNVNLNTNLQISI